MSAPTADALPRPGVARFGHELVLMAGLLALLFWALALVSYVRVDPAWSTSGALDGEGLHNWMGRLGAWWADVSYLAFGGSVWWLMLAAVRTWLLSARRWLHATDMELPRLGQRLHLWFSLALLLGGSCVLEWVWLLRWQAYLPDHAGGVLGYLLGIPALRWLGVTGTTLLCIGAWLMGLSGVLQFSWASLAERLGAVVLALIDLGRRRREKAMDRAQGRRAAREREQVLARERAAGSAVTAAAHDPLHIVTATTEPGDASPAAADPSALQGGAQAAAAGLPPAGDVLGGPATSASPSPASAVPPPGGIASVSALPGLDLLDAPAPPIDTAPDTATLEMTSRLIEKKLRDFGVEVHISQASPGPVITRYEFEPAPGVKGAQIVALGKDLARALSLAAVRVLETVPGKSCMALELPNVRRQPIALSEVLCSPVYRDAASALTLALGKDVQGQPVVADLLRMPHVLVAGTTGSGKSVGINAMILSLLYRNPPSQLRLLLVDPKMLELSVYEGIAHLLCPVVTDMRLAANALAWCVRVMESRYQAMALAGVRNLAAYNAYCLARQQGGAAPTGEDAAPGAAAGGQAPLHGPLPHIVIVIDELADLMMVAGKQVEGHIARLAQKARAAGIHLILATQRPSANVVTGLIKANIPTRMAFAVSSKTDSRIVLDQAGAQDLLGQGDMLYLPAGSTQPVRVHGAFVSDAEVQRVVAYLHKQEGPDYVSGVLDDPADAHDGSIG